MQCWSNSNNKNKHVILKQEKHNKVTMVSDPLCVCLVSRHFTNRGDDFLNKLHYHHCTFSRQIYHSWHLSWENSVLRTQGRRAAQDGRSKIFTVFQFLFRYWLRISSTAKKNHARESSKSPEQLQARLQLYSQHHCSMNTNGTHTCTQDGQSLGATHRFRFFHCFAV